MRATRPSVSACVREKQGGGGRPRETKVCETRDDNDERDSDPAWRRCEIRERELRSGEWRLKSQTPRVRRVRSAGQPVSPCQLGSELAHAARRVGARARSSAGRSSPCWAISPRIARRPHAPAARRVRTPSRRVGSRAGYLLLDRDETTGTNSTKKPQCPPRIRRARRDEPRGPAPVRGYTLHNHT